MHDFELLPPGEFLGAPVTAGQFGGFLLSVTEYPRGATLRWHGHDEPYLTYVTRGSYRERTRINTRDCLQHCLVVHPAGEIHADEFSAATRCLNIHIDRDWRCRFDRALATPVVAASSAISAIIARTARELRSPDGVSAIVTEGLMLELLGELSRSRTADRAPAWLCGVRDEIESRFQDPLTLASLASAADVHPVHLARAFRRHFGRTVGEMIRELRVRHAQNRIRCGLSLREAAAEAGFADQSHMTRTFRSLTGTTPAGFRRAKSVPRS
ncbi:MAG TPA: AraC family transcriptional regulator [Thermoanaerobaculia bacterium]|nr:AraC family transcriptional regulator [Thermoanaerobaculia bacterium]